MNMLLFICIVLFSLHGKTIFQDSLFSLFCLPRVNTASLEYLAESALFILGKEHKQPKIVKQPKQPLKNKINKEKTR